MFAKKWSQSERRGMRVHSHREADEPRTSRRNGLRLSGVWKMLRLQCRVCESSMSHLIPNTAEMPKCLSRDVHAWSRDSRGRTLCPRCNSSSLRLKESGSNVPKLLWTNFILCFVFYITRVSRFVNENNSHSASSSFRIFRFLNISNTTLTERYF